MIKEITLILNSFRYGGLTRQELDMCRPELRKQNVHMLNWIIPAILTLLGILTVASLIPGTGEEGNRALYVSFTVVIVLELLAYKFYYIKHAEKILHLSYTVMLTAYFFGIYEATCLGAESSGTAFCVFLVVVPMVVVDVPWRPALLILIVEAILIGGYFLAVEGFGWIVADRYVIVNSICCTILGICCGQSIQRTKFSDIRNHLMLEIQRDTDMMTGAKSRVAYIRDVGVMSDIGHTAGVIYADVNGLKRTNDLYGHEAGDRLIKSAFSVMLHHFHENNDSIYRIGGDEFVIISLGGDRESFYLRLQDMIRDKANGGIISCGGVWLKNVKDAESAIKEAERMMYEEKDRFYLDHPEHERRGKQQVLYRASAAGSVK